MALPLLEAIALHKAYRDEAGPNPVLEGIDIALEAGSLTAIVGPSGCGKSTLLHLLGLLDEPDRGEVRLGEVHYGALEERERARLRATRIGFVFQFDHLLPELDLAENVAVPLRLVGRERRAARERAVAMLEAVGLGGLGRRFPKELSGGERQRAAIARALVNEPDLLLADEPTGNLDREASTNVLRLFRELACRPGRVVVVATHDEGVAEGCDRVLRLERSALRELRGPAPAAVSPPGPKPSLC